MLANKPTLRAREVEKAFGMHLDLRFLCWKVLTATLWIFCLTMFGIDKGIYSTVARRRLHD